MNGQDFSSKSQNYTIILINQFIIIHNLYVINL